MSKHLQALAGWKTVTMVTTMLRLICGCGCCAAKERGGDYSKKSFLLF